MPEKKCYNSLANLLLKTFASPVFPGDPESPRRYLMSCLILWGSVLGVYRRNGVPEDSVLRYTMILY